MASLYMCVCVHQVLHAAASGAQECRVPESPVDLTLNSLESSPPKVNKSGHNTGTATRSMKKVGSKLEMLEASW